MSIRCPYCRHEMELKGVRPGRFQPACPVCREKFVLTVSPDATVAPSVKPIGETLPPSITMALGIEPPSARTHAPAMMAPPGVAPHAAETRAAGAVATTAPPPAHLAPAPTLDPASAAPAASDGAEISRKLSGYEFLRKLGQGGMGAVYLARQLSLDRNVALKLLLPGFAQDPQFVSRFIREAYAAAQLSHHNVVQIHDIGAERQTHFFSMEFVEGHTLASLIREQGPMDPQIAVNYVLQAARGLKFAHEHGMVHRDVKPENLMLNIHGIIKVADLGLVKIPTAPKQSREDSLRQSAEGKWYADDATQLNVSMGTPAYMPPEQASDAHGVDVRADIYALGCTLYAMVTGRPPFTGQSALEVITKHMREPVTPPDRVVEHVPQYLSGVILKMLAKKPQDRYQSMTAVIAALEEFFGAPTSGPFVPDEQQQKTLTHCVTWFNNSAAAKTRLTMIWLFLPLCALLFVGAFFLPVGPGLKYRIAAGVIGFAILTPVMYLVIQGLHDKTYLFTKVRDYVVGGGIVTLFILLSTLASLAFLLILLNIHWAWLIALAAAVAFAATFHSMIDSLVTEQRQAPVTHAEAMLKQIRSRTAASEAALEQFVCKNAGEHWEGLFEAIFGYEAKIEARKRWGVVTESLGRSGKGDKRRPRPKFAAWRDGIIEWIDMRLRARREAKDKRYLELVERESLKARGFPDAAARKKAREVAVSIVVKAADLREAAREKVLAETEPPGQAEQKSPEAEQAESELSQLRKRRAVLGDEGLEGYEHLSYFQRRFGGWAGFFLGPPVRLVLGALLLVGCLLWAKQNDLLPTRSDVVSASEAGNRAIDELARGKKPPAQVVAEQKAGQLRATRHPALRLRHVARGITDWFDGWHIAVAGVMLILSAFMSAPKLGLFFIPAAAIIVMGPALLAGKPQLVQEGAPVLAGLALATIGFYGTRD